VFTPWKNSKRKDSGQLDHHLANILSGEEADKYASRLSCGQ
jgi:hypothetical protein